MKSLFSSISAIFLALLACTCCVGPFLALAGLIGVSASQLAWLASVKNYLIAFSLMVIFYNLYKAYFPSKKQDCCSIDENQPTLQKNEQKIVSFFQSKLFLWSIAIVTLLILLLPYLTN
ncbi:hypothetical protein UJ101_00476 [Flavobacteriaceae bacterium UJ101]|nr:hypothetical protein UJ101_00476 [Flavobacteriaceae bacterium UJ101]